MSGTDKAVLIGAWFGAGLLLCGAAAVTGFVLIKGIGGFGPQLLFGDTPIADALLLRKPVFNGLLPALAGTLLLVLLSVGMALPVGLAAGIYMAEYGRGRLKELLSLMFDLLAGAPSIVIGLFGFSLTLFLHRHISRSIVPSLLASAASLAFLVLPYIIRTTQAALEGLPKALRATAPALGATRLQNLRFVLLPNAFSAIFSGVVLAIGRCAEDTAVIMLTGAVAMAGIPGSPLGSYEALPFFIYYTAAQYTGPDELQRAYSAALLLMGLCLALFALAGLIRRRLIARMGLRR